MFPGEYDMQLVNLRKKQQQEKNKLIATLPFETYFHRHGRLN